MTPHTAPPLSDKPTTAHHPTPNTETEPMHENDNENLHNALLQQEGSIPQQLEHSQRVYDEQLSVHSSEDVISSNQRDRNEDQSDSALSEESHHVEHVDSEASFLEEEANSLPVEEQSRKENDQESPTQVHATQKLSQHQVQEDNVFDEVPPVMQTNPEENDTSENDAFDHNAESGLSESSPVPAEQSDDTNIPQNEKNAQSTESHQYNEDWNESFEETSAPAEMEKSRVEDVWSDDNFGEQQQEFTPNTSHQSVENIHQSLGEHAQEKIQHPEDSAQDEENDDQETTDLGAASLSSVEKEEVQPSDTEQSSPTQPEKQDEFEHEEWGDDESFPADDADTPMESDTPEAVENTNSESLPLESENVEQVLTEPEERTTKSTTDDDHFEDSNSNDWGEEGHTSTPDVEKTKEDAVWGANDDFQQSTGAFVEEQPQSPTCTSETVAPYKKPQQEEESDADFDSDDDFENAEFHSGDDIDDFSDFDESEFEDNPSPEEASATPSSSITPSSEGAHQPYTNIVNAIVDQKESSLRVAGIADAFFQDIIPLPEGFSIPSPNDDTTSITGISLETLFDKNFSQLSRKFSDIANWSNSSIEEIFLRHIGFVKQQKKRRKHKRLHPASAHTRTFSGLSNVDGASVLSGVTPSTPASSTSLQSRHRPFSTSSTRNNSITEEFSEHELEEFNSMLARSKNARRPSTLGLVSTKRDSLSTYRTDTNSSNTPHEQTSNVENLAISSQTQDSNGFDDNFDSDDDFDAEDFTSGGESGEESRVQISQPTARTTPVIHENDTKVSRERSSSVTRGKTTVSVETSELNMDGMMIRERSPSNPTPPSGSTPKSSTEIPQRNRNHFDDDEFDADFDDEDDFVEASIEERGNDKGAVIQQDTTLSMPSFDDFDFLAPTKQETNAIATTTSAAPSASVLMEFDDFVDLTTSTTRPTETPSASHSSTSSSKDVTDLLDMIPDLDFMQNKDFTKQSTTPQRSSEIASSKQTTVVENILDFF
mmetsp:Transcript_10885/g.40589  ORF Transcript_10885/g.40589 Transcript_10885/m.40589 type:complete len:998 (-) Transcript_10885:71-3064(-)